MPEKGARESSERSFRVQEAVPLGEAGPSVYICARAQKQKSSRMER